MNFKFRFINHTATLLLLNSGMHESYGRRRHLSFTPPLGAYTAHPQVQASWPAAIVLHELLD